MDGYLPNWPSAPRMATPRDSTATAHRMARPIAARVRVSHGDRRGPAAPSATQRCKRDGQEEPADNDLKQPDGAAIDEVESDKPDQANRPDPDVKAQIAPESRQQKAFEPIHVARRSDRSPAQVQGSVKLGTSEMYCRALPARLRGRWREVCTSPPLASKWTRSADEPGIAKGGPIMEPTTSSYQAGSFGQVGSRLSPACRASVCFGGIRTYSTYAMTARG